MLTVICWKWAGWRNVYRAEHVNVLQRMLATHLRMPHRLVCVTDDPAGIECETVPLWSEPNVQRAGPNCYRRLRLFSQDAAQTFGERVLSIDLDCVILDDITPLITDEDFRIVRGRSARYNGSMWLHLCGTRTFLWDEFDAKTSPKAASRYVGSDQAWISHRCGEEAAWDKADGVYHYTLLDKRAPLPSNARIVFFAGAMKPWSYALKREQRPLWEEYRKWR